MATEITAFAMHPPPWRGSHFKPKISNNVKVSFQFLFISLPTPERAWAAQMGAILGSACTNELHLEKNECLMDNKEYGTPELTDCKPLFQKYKNVYKICSAGKQICMNSSGSISTRLLFLLLGHFSLHKNYFVKRIRTTSWGSISTRLKPKQFSLHKNAASYTMVRIVSILDKHCVWQKVLTNIWSKSPNKYMMPSKRDNFSVTPDACATKATPVAKNTWVNGCREPLIAP